MFNSRRAYTGVLKDFFEGQILPNQSLFSPNEHCEKVLEMIPDESEFYLLLRLTMVRDLVTLGEQVYCYILRFA